eukprot:Hpha_TRINITY_DN33693_c0_g1::TRINITY_DN33693_c0_g1_i1::g.43231::m.43231
MYLKTCAPGALCEDVWRCGTKTVTLNPRNSWLTRECVSKRQSSLLPPAVRNVPWLQDIGIMWLRRRTGSCRLGAFRCLIFQVGWISCPLVLIIPWHCWRMEAFSAGGVILRDSATLRSWTAGQRKWRLGGGTLWPSSKTGVSYRGVATRTDWATYPSSAPARCSCPLGMITRRFYYPMARWCAGAPTGGPSVRFRRWGGGRRRWPRGATTLSLYSRMKAWCAGARITTTSALPPRCWTGWCRCMRECTTVWPCCTTGGSYAGGTTPVVSWIYPILRRGWYTCPLGLPTVWLYLTTGRSYAGGISSTVLPRHVRKPTSE